MLTKQNINQKHIHPQLDNSANPDELENISSTLCDYQLSSDDFGKILTSFSQNFEKNYLAVTSKLEEINTTLLKLANQADQSSNFNDSIFIAIIGAISGAIAAYIFNYLHSKSSRKKENISKLASALSDQLKSFEDLSVDYWLTNYSPKISSDLNAKEIKIKASLKGIRFLSKSFCNRLSSNNKTLTDEVKNFSQAIYDIATGEDFESKSRKCSVKTATRISTDCSMIRAKIDDFTFS